MLLVALFLDRPPWTARQPHLASRVHAAVHEGIGAELVTSYGDLVTEEIADAEVEERSIGAPPVEAASD